MPLSFEKGEARSRLPAALEAVRNLTIQELNGVFISGQTAAMSAHAEILHTPINQRTGPFYRHLVPLRQNLVSVLAGCYRRYFKMSLAHPRQTGRDPNNWACAQLQPALGATLEWIRDWYILACDGENQYVQNIGPIPFVPGQRASIPIPLTAPPFPPPESWRAPAWLFEISPLVGVGPLKSKHVPATDSEEKLGEAHTRLLLKGGQRVFLWELGAAIERVRNEEMAAAGAIPAEPAEIVSGQTRRPIKRKGWEQRLKLYSAIQRTLSAHPGLQGMEFCAELDRRHALPLYDWTKRGEWREGLTWREAWGNPRLRNKIRRVRQEAMKGR
jgi:hypothetical protein